MGDLSHCVGSALTNTARQDVHVYVLAHWVLQVLEQVML
jgi:hypothetical protein